MGSDKNFIILQTKYQDWETVKEYGMTLFFETKDEARKKAMQVSAFNFVIASIN